ncbi:MAG TPA: [Fe-S]-binding protein, partial [Planctomycetaceae bacterium]|nr:[Fe-S]-binding protein [Planctomycetaceae bacterium]
MNMILPKFYRVRQNFPSSRIENVAETVRMELAKLNLEKTVKPGESVAITVGSRGIANIALIIKTTVDFLKSIEAVPFIVPAMGSHGGGTADGQT